MNPDEQVTVKDDPPQIDPLDRSGKLSPKFVRNHHTYDLNRLVVMASKVKIYVGEMKPQ